MNGTVSFMLFLSIFCIHFFVLVIPGPDFMVVSRTALIADHKGVLQVICGVISGIVIWSVFSLLGLHILFSHYPFLERIILGAGAAYLFYLSCQIFRHAKDPLVIQKEQTGNNHFFLNGLLTNLTNPKALLYFSSIFSLIHFGEGSYYPLLVLLMIVVESFVWFLLLGLAFSHERIRTIYIGCKFTLDILAASIFLFFSLLFVLKLF